MKSNTWLLNGLKIGRVLRSAYYEKNRDSELWLPSELVTCRLWLQSVETKHNVGLFTAQGIEQKLAARLSSLLLVSILPDDGLSMHLCRKCKNAAVGVEQKLQELQGMAQRSYQIMHKTNAGSIHTLSTASVCRKRPKDTSSGPFVSPYIARVQPPAQKQFSAKRLFGVYTKTK